MMSNCLPNLNWLSLEQCHVDDDAIDALQKLNLKKLNLSHTLITAEGLKILNHSKLHSLDLSNCTRIESALESGPMGLDKLQGVGITPKTFSSGKLFCDSFHPPVIRLDLFRHSSVLKLQKLRLFA